MNYGSLRGVRGCIFCGWAAVVLAVTGAAFIFGIAGWASLFLRASGLGFCYYGYIESYLSEM